MRKTKIVCTVGPASEDKAILTGLANAGMDVMRLNFSHGDFDEHGARIQVAREVAAETGRNIAILLDTKGPEIRTMEVTGGAVNLKTGQSFTLTTDQTVVGDSTRVAVTYEHLNRDLKPGNIVLLDDGLLELRVTEIKGGDVVCEVLNNGELGNKKGVNLPGVSVSLPALSDKDRRDLVFGCEQDVDFVAASFIRKASDVEEIRAHLRANGGDNIRIISKIENQEGIDNFDEILEASDGIMVARGDLGVEIPVENVIFAQKMMIRKCNLVRKPVITATQLLDSMIKNPRPTRAEAGDVSNAILDGTDAVMLSGESAKGDYPVESVRIMAQICERTDTDMDQWRPDHVEHLTGDLAVTESICRSAVDVATALQARAIVVSSFAGKSVRSVRKYFPKAPMLALTTENKTLQQLCLTKGVTSELVAEFQDSDTLFAEAKKRVVAAGLAKPGDKIVVVSGALVARGSTNSLSVHRV
ncbi:pyruvate kinase PykF [Natronospirillum operosum]|uniref:Pyruvate kinase n=1 Tax=Natronospirillum operosum TaxID=2759953 RepID=A0A4Z0WG73_9GAMM|nr:pyruvate kinase PykF [Natronospirillum operosum]TGG94226.1 pyruvate kinase PykF [Natronospirillum operosum]